MLRRGVLRAFVGAFAVLLVGAVGAGVGRGHGSFVVVSLQVAEQPQLELAATQLVDRRVANAAEHISLRITRNLGKTQSTAKCLMNRIFGKTGTTSNRQRTGKKLRAALIVYTFHFTSNFSHNISTQGLRAPLPKNAPRAFYPIK